MKKIITSILFSIIFLYAGTISALGAPVPKLNIALSRPSEAVTRIPFSDIHPVMKRGEEGQRRKAISALGRSISLSYSPSVIMQGEPFMVQVMASSTALTSVKKITFDGKSIGLFMYQNTLTALVGVDLNKKPGVYKVSLALSNGQIITTNVTGLSGKSDNLSLRDYLSDFDLDF